MKSTDLKADRLFSNSDNYSFDDLPKVKSRKLIKSENKTIDSTNIHLHCDSSAFNENIFGYEYGTNDVVKEGSVLEDFYRFQERRNATMDYKKSVSSVTFLSDDKRVYERPNYSYTQLIYMAIESSPQKALTVNDIYQWCEQNFSYYAHAVHGWKNSLRHNLSINKCFRKVTKSGQGGRGSLWIIDPREKQHLIPTMTRKNVPSFAIPLILQSSPKQVDTATYRLYDEDYSDLFQQEDDDCCTTTNVVQLPPSSSASLYQEQSLLIYHPEKSVNNWTDTRLTNDNQNCVHFDNSSIASDTDFNDFYRSLVCPDPIFPPKYHQFDSRGPFYPMVTPAPSNDHLYAIVDIDSAIDDPSLSLRHIFMPISIEKPYSSLTAELNDEDWPHSPSPVASVVAFEEVIVDDLLPAPMNQTAKRRGRPKKISSNYNKRSSTMAISDAPQSLPVVVNNVFCSNIDNMFHLNTFINSL